MIVGIGVDTVDIERFDRHLQRTPALRDRLFYGDERELPIASLAARFAAKEALIKALGDSRGLGWHDMQVVRDADRAPSFVHTSALSHELRAVGADRVHLSMTHERTMAPAFVIVECTGPAPTDIPASAVSPDSTANGEHSVENSEPSVNSEPTANGDKQ
ncbi:MAG: holo-ACP synthase [Leucobacter sp.]|nr:holo-ACP synthase [Leucobacter sp.]